VRPIDFVEKWTSNQLKERSASQEHFLDLCRVLNEPTPASADPAGTFYTFERGASKLGGGEGWADVWKRGHFAWEYKGRHANLEKAYEQLAKYREDLDNPPLLIVSDMDRIEIHTNFTGTAKKVYPITLETFTESESQRILKRVFTDPDSLRPRQSVEAVTEEAAARFSELALGLHQRGHQPHETAHFLMQLLFCLFAEDVGLLPNKMFGRVMDFGRREPTRFSAQLGDLLTAMASGGFVAMERVPHFNGGLFKTVQVLELTSAEIGTLYQASQLDWSSVEPAIFGTLFERSLDPSKRSQLGAHYTSRADIERVIDPVVMTPLRRRWDEVRGELDAVKATWDAAPTQQRRSNRRAEYLKIFNGFREELSQVTVLDPACGSGNFLYVALERLLSLEKEVLAYGASQGLPYGTPSIRPSQVMGLEINEYAHELAQVVIWIGYLQWMLGNGFGYSEPVLETLDSIRLQDALLTFDAGKVSETVWPEADFIVGNPPFLGGNKIRQELGDEYVDTLFSIYDDRLPQFSDLCCYFFEKARNQIETDATQRAGLLATNSIRGGANRQVLKRIKQTGDIYLAWSDEPWVLDGAAVRISIVGFDDGSQVERELNGVPVVTINSDLTATVDITKAAMLRENGEIGFMGMSKKGPFDIPGSLARLWLTAPLNPNGRSNADVVKPWFNGRSITARWNDLWIIDFGTSVTLEDASLYELPFEYVKTYVEPERAKNNRKSYRDRWWLHAEPRPRLRVAVSGLSRMLVTPTVAKHRVFTWLSVESIPDQQLIVFAREDDYFFGMLHSRAHEVWSLRMGTWLGKGNDPRYTPTTCFETFALPWAPGSEPTDDPRVIAIGDAAKRLNELRENWLNPEGASEAELKKRTLTNLYNARPTWLQNSHAALDRAVWAAYGWDDEPNETTDEEILERLLALNGERARQDDGAIGTFVLD